MRGNIDGPLSRVHRRQYFISEQVLDVGLGWKTTNLGAGRFIIHCPDLQVGQHQDADGTTWTLVGVPVQADPHRDSPDLEILKSRSDCVAELTNSWAGRFTLTDGRRIFIDGAGLGALYYRVGDGSDGIIASSSIALLAELTRAQKNTQRTIGWYAMNWYPPPLTTFGQIRKLLHDQILRFDDLSVEYLQRLDSDRFSGMGDSEIGDELVAVIGQIFRGLAGRPEPLCVALSAGRDCRVALAAISHIGVAATTYTMLHPLITAADVKMPAELSEVCGFDHQLIPPGRYSRKRRNAYDAHTGRYACDSNRFFYSRNSFAPIDDGRLLIRSSCLEIGREFWFDRLSQLSFDEACRSGGDLARIFNVPGSRSSVEPAIKSWFEWRTSCPREHDWWSLFYLDSRLGGWLSAIEQSLDLLGESTSVQPFASPLVFDLLLAATDGTRTTAGLWDYVTRALNEDLAEFPVNPEWGQTLRVNVAHKTRYLRAAVGETLNAVRG